MRCFHVHLYRNSQKKVLEQRRYPSTVYPQKERRPRILGICRRIAFALFHVTFPPRGPNITCISPFLKEGKEETFELALIRQNRTLPDGPCLFQKKLAVEIHSSVGERLSEMSTHRGVISSESQCIHSSFTVCSLQASHQHDSASSPSHSRLPSLMQDDEYLPLA